jgi:O-antigen/teichoic acid export membrane protein
VYSLFKPIAEDNTAIISRNIASAERLFRKMSVIFAVIMLIAASVTAMFIDSQLDQRYIFIAFIIMGMKSFLDLFFTSKFRIVFTAFQQKFILSIATLIEQVVYYALVFTAIFLKMHFIYIYLWLFLGCIVKVIYLKFEYRKKFDSRIPKYEGKAVDKIEGRNYSLANEVAHSVVSSSITIILSFMYGLEEASVYSVYVLISSALSLVSMALYSAFAPSFGNIIATDDREGAGRVFSIFQFLYVMLNTFLFLCMLFLLLPFVTIYTTGATDINYANFTLACLLSLHGIFSAYRIPFNIIVSSCGYFKETWLQPVVSAIVSIILSCLLGTINYAFILLGPIVFYFLNFIYQYYKLKKLAPYLISRRVFIMFGISLFGFAITVVACELITLPAEIVTWLGGGIGYAIGMVVYLIVMSRLFVKEDFSVAVRYVKQLVRRRFNNA